MIYFIITVILLGLVYIKYRKSKYDDEIREFMYKLIICDYANRTINPEANTILPEGRVSDIIGYLRLHRVELVPENLFSGDELKAINNGNNFLTELYNEGKINSIEDAIPYLIKLRNE